MNQNSSQLDVGILIRRSLFFLILIGLTLVNLFTLFRGLNSPQAMDQAQMAREIARGNGFATKMIRPAAYHQAAKVQNRSVPFVNFQDTYHSPLNPLLNAAVLKVIGADDADAMPMEAKELIYPLDRVIAAVSTLFFLMSIGVTYLLVSRIFDAKIAGVCAVLMLFCETFWQYSLSGLPQMLMLLLFSCGIYFVYRAVEAASEGRIAMTPAVIAGVFFTLLALTHWVTSSLRQSPSGHAVSLASWCWRWFSSRQSVRCSETTASPGLLSARLSSPYTTVWATERKPR
jgi:Dolichyl-phosphate-mannose-protein mannosyltransferase